jgi:hypothetical protein
MDLAISLPVAIVLASLIVAAAIVYAARLLAQRPSGSQALPPGAAGQVPLLSSGLPFPAMEAPLSSEGFPVEPSGIPIQPETPLEVGSTVLAYSQGRWWRAEVVGLEPDDQVRIRYPGWDSKWDETARRSELQVDLGNSLGSEG